MFVSTALHKLIADAMWDTAVERIQSHPGEVRKLAQCDALQDTFRKSKGLPLHHALAKDAPLHVVQALISSYNKALLMTETAYHRTPLHVACMNGAKSTVVFALIAGASETTRLLDDLKRSPLHYAIANGCSMKTIERLLEEAPDAIQGFDHRHWLPLHIACGVQAPLHVVRLLLEKYPDSIKIPGDHGRLPMTMARQVTNPVGDVVEYLEEAFRKASDVPELIEFPMSTGDEEYVSVK